MEKIDFNSYQDFTATTALYDNMLYPVMGLAEEAGEVVGKFAKAIRDEKDFPEDEIVKELGDVLWMLARVAGDMNISLQEVAERNVTKLKDRQQRNALRGSGDSR